MMKLRAGVWFISILLSGAIIILAGCNGPKVETKDSNATSSDFPKTGPNVPGVEAYDNVIPALMTKWNTPGAAVAVAKDGHLLLARGYGYADKENNVPVEPDMLFRIASLTKSITSATILHLVEQGKLRLDDKFVDILRKEYPLPKGADPRLRKITLRNLLQHSGGWDRDSINYDPMGDPGHIATALGVTAPALCPDIIRYMLAKPLQFDPGTNYVYSNFGYCILGRVIEKVIGKGQPYDEYVKGTVLAPLDIHAMRIGHSLLSGRAPNEVKYYDMGGTGQAPSVFPGGGNVPSPYGSFSIEAMDSHGGWIASAIDITRLLSGLDGHRGSAFLSPSSMAQMIARPDIPKWKGTDNWYGMGLKVRPQGGDANWQHTGLLPGTSTLMVRSYNGYCWAVLTNFSAADTDKFSAELDAAMWKALGSGLAGSPSDLYAQFPSKTP
jgi:CubicO group peptidase (beta-lactamase class C family)